MKSPKAADPPAEPADRALIEVRTMDQAHTDQLLRFGFHRQRQHFLVLLLRHAIEEGKPFRLKELLLPHIDQRLSLVFEQARVFQLFEEDLGIFVRPTIGFCLHEFDRPINDPGLATVILSLVTLISMPRIFAGMP
jgi:hypothetical protein